jgi:pimeloyl-ACP methyl ester carboxylesterase
LLEDVTVVLPALPGFPFAAPVPSGGLSSIEMGDAVAAAMAEFGYNDYVISAGDVGCDVAEAIAARHGQAVRALHLTDLSQYHFLADLPEDLDDVERAYVVHGHAWQRASGGYMHEQSTRPRTLAAGLGDSPAGLAAWILEKTADWTDGEDISEAFTLDEATTWIAAYWFSRTIGTSFAPYAAATKKDWPRIGIPTVMTVFPADLVNAPRQFAERFFTIADWLEFPHGGHFAAWEQPSQYVQGIRRAVTLRLKAVR